MGFFARRGSPHGGVFETTDLIPVDDWDEKTARQQYVLNGFAPPEQINLGLCVFRASNNQTYRHAVLYHNAAIEQGYHSEFTQIDRHNWQVFVDETAPQRIEPCAGISDAPLGSSQWLLDVAEHQRVEREKSKTSPSDPDG